MKKVLFLLIFTFPITFSFGQKSSPIVGDAATLIDLLKKDYNIINPDSWDEEINTDRGKVIGIFKSYLGEAEKNLITSKLDPNLKTKFDDYMDLKEKVNAISKVSITISVANVSVPASEKQIITSDKQFETIRDGLIKLQTDLKNKKDEYYKLKNTEDRNEFTKLESGFVDNGYLLGIISLFKTKYKNLYENNIDVNAEKNTYASIQKSIPFIGGDLSFETIIDGLSRFLAKRIKEELTIHAIDKIKEYLDHPSPENYCHELLVLLPTTTNYLKSFESNQLMNFTDELKQYIEQDLNDLLINAVNLKDTPRLKKYIEKKPDLEFAFEGLKIIPQLSKIKNPIDYFEILENSRNLARWRSTPITTPEDKSRYNISQGFRLASMLAYSMTVVDNGETKFASLDMISNYGNEINFFYLYFGMLHQQNKKYFNVGFIPSSSSTPIPINIGKMMEFNAFPFQSMQSTQSKKISETLKFNLTTVCSNAEKIYSQGLALKKKNKNNEEVKYEEVYDFIDNFISFGEEIVATSAFFLNEDFKIYSSYHPVPVLPASNGISLKDQMAPYFSVSRIANNMMLDLHQKKYSNAIIKAIEIPLSFKIKDGTAITMLQDVKTAFESQKDLEKMKNAFNPGLLTTDSDEIKKQKLEAAQPYLEILSLKLDEAKDISKLKRKLGKLNDSILALITNSDKLKNTVSQYIEVRNLFKDEYKAVLNHYGINTTEIANTIKSKLESRNRNSKVVTFLEKKFDEYTQTIYCNVILGDDLDISIENQLVAFVDEFAVPSPENVSKVNDNNAIKVIHFVNEMAGAKDAEEVEKAITAFALPVGSSSLKEKAKSYFSINAYPGLIAGFEYSKGLDRAETYGFTAPVGLHAHFYSWEKGGTLGAFIPIIDIGAPVRLRMDSENDTKTLPDFNFNDIFSPGFYLSYGFGKKLPLAINFGAQYGPKLRDIDVGNDGKFDSIDSYRVSVALVIDLPLFTISGKY